MLILATLSSLMILALIAQRGLWPLLAVGIALLPVTLGLFARLTAVNDGGARLFLLAYLAFLLAGVAFDLMRATARAKGPAHRKSVEAPRGAAVIVTLVTLGTIVHFLRSGIPLLSSNVEVARFSAGDSGLFGLPGRLYLFGLPLALAMCLKRDQLAGARIGSTGLSRVILGTFLLSRLLSGFKSGVLEVASTYFVLLVLVGAEFDRERIRRFVAGISVAAGFALLIGSQYGTYHRTGTVNSLKVRLTEQSTEAAGAVLQARESRIYGRSVVSQDFPYFLHRYARVGVGRDFSFNQRVSANLIGTPLTGTAFIVPVTTTAIAEEIYEAGAVKGIGLLGLIGLCYQWLVARALRTSGLRPFLLSAASVLAAMSFLTKGGLVYAALNWAVVAALLLAVQATFNRLTQRRGSSSRLTRRSVEYV